LTCVTCPCCDGSNLLELVRIEAVPVLCNVLHQNAAEARGADRGDLDLIYCRTCAHLWNGAFDPDRVAYDADYENSLHYSPRFQEWARGLSADLVASYGLQGGTVVEIACGKGDFLGLLREAGASRAVGFDPSWESNRDGATSPDGVEVRRELFTASTAGDLTCDLLCCRHALEHIGDPVAFLQLVHDSLTASPKAPIYFEVPNGLWTLRDLGIWDLIYEHPQYFSACSLLRAMNRAGFEVTGIDEAFGGQFLSCRAIRSEHPGASIKVPLDDPEELGDRFGAAYREHRTRWADRLLEWRRRGSRAIIWGAGSKGVTFLNVIGAGVEIAAVVDINPHKQGRFVPGSGHRVVSPAEIAGLNVDIVVVMNPLYRDEIAATLAALNCRLEILTVDS